MSDTETPAATPVEGTPATPETPVNDGIIDLDAPEEVKEESEEGNEGDKSEEAKATAAKAAEEAAETEKKKLSGAQRAKIREQRLRDALSARDRELEELRARAPATKASEGEEKAPKEDDFNGDWFAYQSALTAYNASKAVRDEIRKDREAQQAATQREREQAYLREREIAFNEAVIEKREMIADLEETLQAAAKTANETGRKPFTADLMREIADSEKSVEIAYTLLKNPDKLSELNSMSGLELAREMGRLEATVKMPEAKKATSAPAPLSRPKGGASPSSPEADLQAWMKKKYGTR